MAEFLAERKIVLQVEVDEATIISERFDHLHIGLRRPEVEGFISIAPPANLYDFSFLAPCPSSGLIVHGEKDAVVPPKDVNTLVEKLKTQKGIVIDQQVIPGANHFFDGKLQPLMETVTGYLDMRLANVR